MTEKCHKIQSCAGWPVVWNRKHLDILIAAMLSTVSVISFSSVISRVEKNNKTEQLQDMLHINLYNLPKQNEQQDTGGSC